MTARPPAERAQLLEADGRPRGGGRARRPSCVVALDARDLLDQVGRDRRRRRAPGRDDDAEPAARASTWKPSRSSPRAPPRQCGPAERRTNSDMGSDGPRRGRTRVAVGPALDRSGRRPARAAAGPARPAITVARDRSPSRTRALARAQPVTDRAGRIAGVERRGLEEDRRRVGSDLGRLAAHHARERDGRSASAITRSSGVERAVDSVERRRRSPGRARRTTMRPPASSRGRTRAAAARTRASRSS